MGCFFSNNKNLNNTTKPKNNSLETTNLFRYDYSHPLLLNENNIKYKLIKNKFTKKNLFQTIKYLKNFIVNIHKSLLLNTNYSIYDLQSDIREIKVLKIKCIKAEKNEYVFIMSSYRFTFIILDYRNVNLHIHFTNHIYNVVQYTNKNNLDGESLIKNYVKNIEFCSFTNMEYSLNGYFDWSISTYYKQSVFNMNNFNDNIKVYIIVPIITKNLKQQLY